MYHFYYNPIALQLFFTQPRNILSRVLFPINRAIFQKPLRQFDHLPQHGQTRDSEQHPQKSSNVSAQIVPIIQVDLFQFLNRRSDSTEDHQDAVAVISVSLLTQNKWGVGLEVP